MEEFLFEQSSSHNTLHEICQADLFYPGFLAAASWTWTIYWNFQIIKKMLTNLAAKFVVAVALVAQSCEAAILAPNITTTAITTSATTNGVTNEQIAGALAAALAGNGGSFGAFGDVILEMGDVAAAPRAGATPMGLNGARPNGAPWRSIPRPCKFVTDILFMRRLMTITSCTNGYRPVRQNQRSSRSFDI